MKSIRALSVTATVHNWMANTRHPKILYVFDQACNLINEQREVISIVTTQVGNGPFNAVAENGVMFSRNLQLESSVSIVGSQLIVGNLSITMADSTCWSPSPDWERLHDNRENITRQLAAFPVPPSQLPNTLRSGLPLALVRENIPVSTLLASQLAGLGMGLTPAGDDYILGALYAAWIIHPLETAKAVGDEIANTVSPLTTSLSAAWLRAAGRGEAGIRWHKFFTALVRCDTRQVKYTMNHILATGATSGADALAGFIGTFLSYAEIKNQICPS